MSPMVVLAMPSTREHSRKLNPASRCRRRVCRSCRMVILGVGMAEPIKIGQHAHRSGHSRAPCLSAFSLKPCPGSTEIGIRDAVKYAVRTGRNTSWNFHGLVSWMLTCPKDLKTNLHSRMLALHSSCGVQMHQRRNFL